VTVNFALPFRLFCALGYGQFFDWHHLPKVVDPRWQQYAIFDASCSSSWPLSMVALCSRAAARSSRTCAAPIEGLLTVRRASNIGNLSDSSREKLHIILGHVPACSLDDSNLAELS
jgi:hypothetical protein